MAFRGNDAENGSNPPDNPLNPVIHSTLHKADPNPKPYTLNPRCSFWALFASFSSFSSGRASYRRVPNPKAETGFRVQQLRVEQSQKNYPPQESSTLGNHIFDSS